MGFSLPFVQHSAVLFHNHFLSHRGRAEKDNFVFAFVPSGLRGSMEPILMEVDGEKQIKSQRRRVRKKLKKDGTTGDENAEHPDVNHRPVVSDIDAVENLGRNSSAPVIIARKKGSVSSFQTESATDPPSLGNELNGHSVPAQSPGQEGKKKSRRKRKKELPTAAVADSLEEPLEHGSTLPGRSADSVHSELPGFTIIGAQKPSKKIKLPPFLPSWYNTPNAIASNLKDSLVPVDSLPGLHPVFVPLLKEEGITHFFPVQSAILPEILGYHTFQRYYARRPHDLCVCAPTGSGKTLAYVLPIVQDLKNRTTRKIRALVLLPVKELAVQVAEVFQTYTKGTHVKVALICGRQSLEQERRQFFAADPVADYLSSALPDAMENLRINQECIVDIVVATPGRLVEHLYETEALDFQALEYLVVDEADRMIEEFKNNWFRLLERSIFRNPSVRPALQYNCVSDFERPSLPLQKLLFSATLSYDPQRFETLKLYRPKLFSVVPSEQDQDILMRNDAEVIGTYVTPEGLKELSLLTDPRLKPLVVLYLLHVLGWNHVLIFTNSIENTHRLYLLIKFFKGKRQISVQEISSGVHQRKRQASLDGFEKGNVDVLVASDSMARGIDLPNVKYVLLYDSPLHVKTYIHRSGRTARAGKSGTTLTLLKANEKKDFERIMKELKKKMPEKMAVAPTDLSQLESPYKVALQMLEEELKPKF